MSFRILMGLKIVFKKKNEPTLTNGNQKEGHFVWIFPPQKINKKKTIIF